MGSMSIWHWLVVAIIVLVLFGGRGKISDIMGDFAKGIKSFKKGMADEEPAQAAGEPVKNITEQANTAATKVSEKAS
jgi:sec-independent protein translocase protein TatA